MLAIRKLARGIGNIEVQDVPEPSAGPDQVVIKVDSAGICGTDLHIYLDEFETRPPVTIGHEVAGRIVEVGRDVTGWKEGDRVTTETYFYTWPMRQLSTGQTQSLFAATLDWLQRRRCFRGIPGDPGVQRPSHSGRT